jgi:hypothetical protein
MPISALNFLWLTDPHDLQGIPANRSGRLGFPIVRYSFYKMVRLLASNMLYVTSVLAANLR